ncbi:hypothetical protein ACQCVB_15255 [Fictibacillus phosphorivorans]|uniref:hypothetical protein n=1 Tax=Fictibacillus phosphorivorans TaxID=1221500 RepID=UPI003CEFB18B
MKNQTLFTNPPTLESNDIKLIPLELEHSLPLFQINHSEMGLYVNYNRHSTGNENMG